MVHRARGRPAEGAAPGPGPSLLARYATALAELLGGVPADATGPATDATGPATADAAPAAPGRGRRDGRALLRRLARLAFAAALAAVLLGPVAGAVPVPEARAAATDLTLVGAATYTVLPDDGKVRVTVDFTVRNRVPESKTRRYYFDRAYIAVLPGTVAFRVSQWKGSTVHVTKRTSDYTMLRIDFGSRLYSGKAHDLRLTFDLPDPGRGANRQVRVGTSLVTFPVWAYASEGAQGSTVTVRFPAGYEVAVESGSFDRQAQGADGGTVLQAGPLAHPLTFFAYVSGQRPAVYVDTPPERGGRAPGDRPHAARLGGRSRLAIARRPAVAGRPARPAPRDRAGLAVRRCRWSSRRP